MRQQSLMGFVSVLSACVMFLGLSNAAVAEVTSMTFDITNNSSADLIFEIDEDNKHYKNVKFVYNNNWVDSRNIKSGKQEKIA